MRIYFLAVALLLTACASEYSSSATAFVPGGEYNTVFRNLTSAAVSAGFTILSARAETGQISATRSTSSLLNKSNPAIDITVARAGGGVQISVASAVERSVGGRIIDTGDPRSTMRDFCTAMLDVIPGSTCKVQQQPAK